MKKLTEASNKSTGTAKPVVNDKQQPTKRTAKPRSKPATASRKRARKTVPIILEDNEENFTRSTYTPLMGLPLELFIEIARYLCPVDIVLLARVSKFFNGLLTHRSSIPIWHTVRLNIKNLPRCPEDLSELRYAALLFLNECSMCGELTNRNAYLILRVRLCADCEKKRQVIIHIRKTNPKKILATYCPYQDAGRGDVSCLSKDFETVKAEHKALKEAGCEEKLNAWIKERRRLVKGIQEFARKLGTWRQAREYEERQDIARRQKARQVEIEARLKALGWQSEDFTQYSWEQQRAWSSLVYNSEPLTDQSWDTVLPKLVKIMKTERRERIERATRHRRTERSCILQSWLTSELKQLTPLAWATKISPKKPVPSDSSSEDAVDPSMNAQPQKRYSLDVSLPSTYSIAAWPDFQTLVDNDIPRDEFQLELGTRHDALIQGLHNWRTTTEYELVKSMPEGIQPVDVQGTFFNLTTGKEEDPQPIDMLSLDTRKLLRADAIFGTIGFYPQGFRAYTGNERNMGYNTSASIVAKALLKELKLPNASHLELSSLGYSFLCTRCCEYPVFRNWAEMISHYQLETSHYRTISASRRFRNAEDFRYVFMHDIDSSISGRPLVQIIDKSTFVRESRAEDGTYSCKVCMKGAGIFSKIWGERHIEDHVRAVHLIDTPKLGAHYTMASI